MQAPALPTMARLMAWLEAEQDAASLGFFRACFGLLMVISTIRYVAMGWVETILVQPSYHFTYTGFEWVRPLSLPGMYAIFFTMTLAAFGIMAGWRTRLMAAIFFTLFTWVELIEKAAYLNHYYLVSLLAALFVLMPCDEAWSVRARTGRRGAVVPRWHYIWFRAQVGLVYVFAGLAKLDTDWLLRGEPLHTWLQHSTHLPLVGPYVDERSVAIAMSWAGAGFDLFIVFFLLWPRTRKLAYLIAVGFHLTVWALFPIGIFSPVMLLCATLFFSASWPRKLPLVGRQIREPHAFESGAMRLEGMSSSRFTGLMASLMVCWLAVQVVLPLRHFAYPGETNWTERGFRFAWRVMLIEKTGQIDYRVRFPERPSERERRVSPRKDLTPLQYRMLCTQPDMMLAYARHIEQELRSSGEASPLEPLVIEADAFVAWNGRRSQRYLDPTQNLLELDPWWTWRTHPNWIANPISP